MRGYGIDTGAHKLPPNHPYEVIRRNREKARQDKVRREADRDDPAWHSKLVEHFLDARSEHETFWEAVDRNYWQKDIQGLAASPEAQLSEVKPGRVYSFVSLVEAMVFNRAPQIYLKGLRTREQEIQPAMEKALNAEFQENGHLKKELKMCSRDAPRYGWAIAMTSYDPGEAPTRDDEESERLRKQAAQDPAAAMLENDAEQAFSDAEARDIPPEERVTFQQDERIVTGQMVTVRIPPKSFICDPNSTSQHDWRWCGRVIVAHKDAVLEDSTLENTDELQVASEDDIARWMGRKRSDKCPYDMVILYEIFERLPDGTWELTVTSPGCKSFLRKEESPYWGGHPYSLCRWNEDGDGIFAQSDLLPMWTDYLSEIILRTKVIQAYARQQQDVTFYDNQLGDLTLKGTHDPNVARMIPVQVPGNQARMQDLFFRLPKDQISPEALNLLAMLQRSFEISSGFGPNQYGQALKSETSASEANEIANFSRARGAPKSDGFEDFVRDIVWKRVAGMIQFYTRGQVKRLIGPELGAKWPLDWVRTDVTNGLRITVHPGSMRPENPQVRLQSLMSVLQLAMSNPVIAATVDMPGLVERMLRMGLDIGDGDGVLSQMLNREQMSGLFAQQAVAGGGTGSPTSSNVPQSAGATAQFAQGGA